MYHKMLTQNSTAKFPLYLAGTNNTIEIKRHFMRRILIQKKSISFTQQFIALHADLLVQILKTLVTK